MSDMGKSGFVQRMSVHQTRISGSIYRAGNGKGDTIGSMDINLEGVLEGLRLAERDEDIAVAALALCDLHEEQGVEPWAFSLALMLLRPKEMVGRAYFTDRRLWEVGGTAIALHPSYDHPDEESLEWAMEVMGIKEGVIERNAYKASCLIIQPDEAVSIIRRRALILLAETAPDR